MALSVSDLLVVVHSGFHDSAYLLYVFHDFALATTSGRVTNPLTPVGYYPHADPSPVAPIRFPPTTGRAHWRSALVSSAPIPSLLLP